MNRTYKAVLKAFLLVGAAVGFVLLATDGPTEQETEQSAYCANVREGVWPDFHHTYKLECGGKDPPKFNENLTK